MHQADFFLGEASDLIDLNKVEMSLLALYNAAFHAARIAAASQARYVVRTSSGYRPAIASKASIRAPMPSSLEAARASPTVRASGPSGSMA